MDIRSTLKTGIAELRAAEVSSYTLSAELLLLFSIQRDRTWIYAHPEENLSETDVQRYLSLIERRAKGEPTQHLTGKQEFWSLEFEVNSDVLIPRPETEHLIEVALDRLALREVQAGRPPKNTGNGLAVADIGTGSGCIAVTLAKELSQAIVYATDISAPALAVARRNAQRHSATERIQFVQCNLLDGVTSPPFFDLIVSNPPYVGRVEALTLAREVRDHEPESALYGGEEGYELYAELIVQARTRLAFGGILVLELGHASLPAVRPLLDAESWVSVGVTNDLAGIPRVIAAARL